MRYFAAVCSHRDGQNATCMLLKGVLWAYCNATLLSSDANAMLTRFVTTWIGK